MMLGGVHYMGVQDIESEHSGILNLVSNVQEVSVEEVSYGGELMETGRTWML